jgi:hypothetical protein
MNASDNHHPAHRLHHIARGCLAVIALALQLAALAHLHLGERVGADDSHCAWCAVAHSPAVPATAPPTLSRPLVALAPPAVPAKSAPPARAFDSAPARAPPTS